MFKKIILFMLLTSCGYSFVQSDTLYSAKTIAVMPFAENIPLGMSKDFTQAMIEQLAQGGVSIALNAKHAEAVLSGKILSSSTQGSPTPVGGTIPSYQLTARIEVTLSDTQGKKLNTIILDVSEDFLAVDMNDTHAILGTESNRRRAIVRLSQKAAKQIYERLVLQNYNRKEEK